MVYVSIRNWFVLGTKCCCRVSINIGFFNNKNFDFIQIKIQNTIMMRFIHLCCILELYSLKLIQFLINSKIGLLINKSEEERIKLFYFYIHYELDSKLFNLDFYIHIHTVWWHFMEFGFFRNQNFVSKTVSLPKYWINFVLLTKKSNMSNNSY